MYQIVHYCMLRVNVGEKQSFPFNILCSSFRTRVLLMNTFNLAEDSITIDSVLEWITKLNTTFPEQFAEIANKLENCDLKTELKTVCFSLLQSS